MGSYRLSTIEGRRLPAPLLFSDGLVTSGEMVLRSDLTFTETLEFRIANGTETHTTRKSTQNGTYSVDGKTVVMKVAAGIPGYTYWGEVEDRTLRVTFGPTVMIYEK